MQQRRGLKMTLKDELIVLETRADLINWDYGNFYILKKYMMMYFY